MDEVVSSRVVSSTHTWPGVAADCTREAAEAAALADTAVARFIDGQAVRKVIVVPGKIVNIVVA